uniref:Neuropeptides capa receptor n=1 Tax=Lygus hesperus TaxID=30085 RepID=A0A0A9WSE9_LYGHE
MNKNPSDSQLPRVRDFSREDFIRERLGSQQLPFALPVTLVYAAIFITGVVGNLAICRVIAKNQSMQTSTNYYLFSLAISDLSLLILGLPNEVSLYWKQYPWQFGTPVCKLRALVSEMTSYTSVLTIVAFSMERYLAICHPLHNYSMSGLHRAIKIIGALWVVSLLAASPFAIYTKINYLQYPEGSGNDLPETAFCAMLKENIPKGFPIYELSFLLFFLCADEDHHRSIHSHWEEDTIKRE